MSYAKMMVLLVAIAATSLSGCAGCQNNLKHMQSNWYGLNRKITLYSADGSVLREWETKAKVEDEGGTCYFLDNGGKAVIVSGVFVIEEIDD